MPWPKTLGRPAAWALTSSVCMGLKSPDAPAYMTRSVRVSSWVTTGASSPSFTSSKNSFCSAMTRAYPFAGANVKVRSGLDEHVHHQAGWGRHRSPAGGEGPDRRGRCADDGGQQ